jgi:hypothetical protein
MGGRSIMPAFALRHGLSLRAMSRATGAGLARPELSAQVSKKLLRADQNDLTGKKETASVRRLRRRWGHRFSECKCGCGARTYHLDKNLNLTNVQCPNCKEWFLARGKRQIFCTTRCANGYRRRHGHGVFHTKACAFCNGIFQTTRSDKRYCCPSCVRAGELHRTYVRLPRVISLCLVCGLEFEKTKDNKKKYCGWDCQHKALLVEQQRQRDELDDRYAAALVLRDLGGRVKDVPPEIVELQRNKVRLLRALQQQRKEKQSCTRTTLAATLRMQLAVC